MTRLFKFFEQNWEVKLLEDNLKAGAGATSSTNPKMPRKQFELKPLTNRNSPLAYLDDLVSEYMRVHYKYINIKDLFEFNYVLDSLLQQDPSALASHFVRMLFHSTFFAVFADAVILIGTMKPLRYFYNTKNAEEYYNRLGKVPSLKEKLFKSFTKDTVGLLIRSKLYLGTEQFKNSALKIVSRFGELTELMTRLDSNLLKLFEAFPFDEFYLEGMICRVLAHLSLYYQVQHVAR
jgi:hypothetical protein